jgi:YidC/Oxa1 family membrane protein insertase
MDKRTILWVLLFMCTMFLVNLFFEKYNQGNLQKWQEQQQAKQEEKIKKLSEEVAQRTAVAEQLPLVTLYADAEGKKFLTTGVKSGKAILTLAWTSSLPKQVFSKKFDSQEPLQEFFLAGSSSINASPAIYRQKDEDLLRMSSLSEFGKYDLQVIIPQGAQKPDIYLGDYTDGHFFIPVEKVAQLKKEMREGAQPVPQIGNGIVLLKTAEGYLPVAIYNREQQVLEYLDNIASLSDFLQKYEVKAAVTPTQKGEEKFYVLETPYQQLVFSNYGGALVEINLPFQSETNKLSVVKEIAFDRDIVNNHPYNARFPAHPYFTPGSSLAEAVKHTEGTLGGYYPLIRRDLIESGNRKSIRVNPRYYSLNIVSDYPETAELVYDVKEFDKNKITFETVQPHRRITKTFSIDSVNSEAPYCLNLTVKVEGDGRGLWLISGIPEVEWISGSPAPNLKYRITRNQKVEVETIDLPKDSITVSSIYPDWVCNSNGFLGVILDPINEIEPGYRAQYVSGVAVPSRLVEIGQEYHRFNPQNLPGYMVMLPLKSSGGLMNFRVFAGPFADGILKTVDKTYSNPATGYNPDYLGCQSFHGWFSFISEPFARFLFILMNFFHTLTGSWAFSIILLTVALRIMLYPLNAWSTKSMLRMQQIAPEVTAIQEKYKKDPKKVQLEIMNLYRDRGVNPISGCFPILIQMPFLIGMFDLLKSTFELRGASFIPGWIDDLTAPDVLFSWTTPIFFFGNQFHLLPILLGIVMYLQQRLMSPLPKDPSMLTEQQRQQKFMGNIMAIVFTVMFYNFPSGLNIYWLSSMLLGILQQYWTSKTMKAKIDAEIEGKEKKKSAVRNEGFG